MLHISTVDPATYTLLKEIFTIDFVNQQCALAGGTSLALQIGHRKSIDLDIFFQQKFDVKELEIILKQHEAFNFQYVGNNSSMLFALINNIKCDFVTEPARLINPFIVIDGVNYFSIADIAAMKMHTICGRGKKKDFFDIYSLLEIYSWSQLLDWFLLKYDETQLFFLQRSILYFQDAEDDPEINALPPYLKTWEEVKLIITEKCG